MKKIRFKLFFWGFSCSVIIFGCSNVNDTAAIFENQRMLTGQYGTTSYFKEDYQKLLTTKNCPNCIINGNQVNLSNLDLSGANLNSAEIAGANLSGANLSGADLRGVKVKANIDAVNFSNAKLDRVTIGGKLSEINFSGASLIKADILVALN